MPHLGTVVSEAGSAYTWAENAHEFRLTPWHNDPVTDRSGEAIYLRDEETGHFWSCSASTLPRTRPVPDPSRFRLQRVRARRRRHLQRAVDLCGAGCADQILATCRFSNRSGRRRSLSSPGMWNGCWAICAANRRCMWSPKSDPASGAFFARNAYSVEFSERVAFFDTDTIDHSISGDRTEFIGRNGSLRPHPAAMQHAGLSGRMGGGLDPCAAMQVSIDLDDGDEPGSGLASRGSQRHGRRPRLVQRYRGSLGRQPRNLRQYASTGVRCSGVIRVETRRPSDRCHGQWLVDVSGHRLPFPGPQRLLPVRWRHRFSRSTAGQHGDDPCRSRQRACASVAVRGHQYAEGDVQHWWHPPLDRGVRTALLG